MDVYHHDTIPEYLKMFPEELYCMFVAALTGISTCSLFEFRLA